MKLRIQQGYDSPPEETAYDDCVLDNRNELIVRKGGEPIKSCYPVEWSYFVHHVIDPMRSLAAPVIGLLERPSESSKWPTCDYLSHLVADIGLDCWHPSRENAVVFWTVFPDGTADCLADSYLQDRSYLAKHGDAVRVLNNPFFHKDPNANERRLVEIAEDNGLRFALDRIAVLPPPETLAREIALLNHGFRNSEKVESVQSCLVASIAETMADWGLKPTVENE